MRRLSLFSLIVVTGVSLMLIGCAKEPAQEIGAAKAAVDAAKAAQADKYLASDFMALQAALTSALDDIQAQAKKSPMSRSYDKAKASLVSIAAKAAELKAKAAEEMAKVQSELEATLSKLNVEIAKAKEMTKKAPKTKKAKSKVIAAAEANAATAATMKASGDFAGALDAAKAGITTLESTKAETTAKVEKQSKHKSKRKR